MNDTPLILIDGASSGIGKETVLKLNKEGFKTVGIARRSEKLEELKASCPFPDLFSYEIRDLGSDVASLSDFVDSLVAKYGKFSGFVHAAGVLNQQPVKMIDFDDLLSDFNTNLFSALFIIKGLIRKRNRQSHLNIVLVSSIAAKIGNPGSVTYGMTKAAMNNLVTSLAQEVGGTNIHLNAVMPGGTKTEMAEYYNNSLPYDYLEKCREKNVFHKDGLPEYIADVIAFLLSEKSYWIQGQSITVDGGETLS